jgi:tetratricopeptide (TPR) repeat protein
MSRTLSQLVLIVILSSMTAWAGFIRGQVTFDNGQPAARVVIRLRSDVIAYQTEIQTDPEGKFDFDGLPLSTYHLTIEGQGFYTYTTRIDISISKMAYEMITLRLNKRAAAKSLPPEGPTGALDARLAEVPPAALKEYQQGEKLVHEKKDLKQGIQHLLQAIKLYDKFQEAYLLLGLAYLDERKFVDSEVALRKATELDPHAAGAYLGLGVVFNAGKRFAEAEKVLTRGLALKPDDARGQFELARTYWATGHWQQAQEHAQKAVAFMPQLAPAYVILGNAALHNHDNATALEQYKMYLRLDPKGPMAEPTRQMIGRIEAALKQAEKQKKK